MATRARSGADLAVTINANTSAPSNTIVISSSGNVTTANDLSLTGHLVGYVSNTYLQATFAQNTATASLATDRLQVANAATTYLTKSVALTSNNSLVNLINDREQVANAAVSYVTKAVHLTSNNALINLINDRYQPANLASDLVSYWPSANIIAYVGSAGGGTSMQTNTSIFIASGGETEVAIPYSNTNYLSVKLNGVRLTPGEDYTSANNTHIGNMLALAAADVLTVTEYKQHTANLVNRSSGGGGGGGGSNVQGSEFGYAAGGIAWPAIDHNSINKYSFTSDGNATDVGDLTSAGSVSAPASFSSPTHGYVARFQSGSPPYKNDIEKFPFASDTNSTNIGEQTIGSTYGRHLATSFTSTDAYHVETCNSTTPAPSLSAAAPFFTPGTGPGAYAMKIMKYPFSSETYSHSGGWLSDFTPFDCNAGAVSSSTHGYVSPFKSSCFHPLACAAYWKYPFAISDAFASNVGDILAPVCSGGNNPTMTCGRRQGGQVGYQSDSNGYFYQNDVYDVNAAIVKFPFASDTNATKVLELTCHPAGTTGRGFVGTTSSTAGGYSHGGVRFDPAGPYFTADNTIDKFPFASDTNAADVGDLLYSACNNTSSNVQN